jgi:hypothetical protein
MADFFTAPPETPIYTASFAPADRWLFWPRLCLYVDRLELTGWRGWRRVRRTVPLRQIHRVAAPDDETLVVQTQCHAGFTIQVEDAPQWADAVRSFRASLDDAANG